MPEEHQGKCHEVVDVEHRHSEGLWVQDLVEEAYDEEEVAARLQLFLEVSEDLNEFLISLLVLVKLHQKVDAQVGDVGEE